MAGFNIVQFGVGLVGLLAIAGGAWGLTAVITKNIDSKDTTTNFTSVISQLVGINFAITLVLFFLSVWFTYNNQINERMYLLVMIAVSIFLGLNSLAITSLTQVA